MKSVAANRGRRQWVEKGLTITRFWGLPAGMLCLAAALAGCGLAKSKDKPATALGSPGEKAFSIAAATYHVPSRLLMAVAYLESQLAPEVASAIYGGGARGPRLGETAFGISREALGLGLGAEHDDLDHQIDAYAKWLTEQVPPGLPAAPVSNDEKFLWIWELAQLHRSKSNTRSLFTRELIAVLNEGFTWLDPRTGDLVKFAPEQPPIDVEALQAVAQKRLALDVRRSEVNTARMLVLRSEYGHVAEQKPRGIEVIHCPFSLSACLELQVQDAPQASFALGAHYVIPPDESLSDVALQVALHDEAVPGLAADGSRLTSADRVVLMLVGQSGRLIAGKRQFVNPAWISKWQLKRMGELVHDVCARLAYFAHLRDEEFSVDECTRVDEGTVFRTGQGATGFHWGDIVDYDPLLFRSYAERPDGLEGQTVFEFVDKKQEFVAGEEIKLDLTFDVRVQHLELERLVRCPDDSVVWSPMASDDVRSAVSFPFKVKLWDAGPNGNGSQFFRAKVYGAEGDMRGWDLTTVLLSKFEATPALAPQSCRLAQGQVR